MKKKPAAERALVKPNHFDPPKPAPKPLAVGETALVTGADDLRGYNPEAAERMIGQLTYQIHVLTTRHAQMSARTRAVMAAHGAEMDDAAKAYSLDTEKMTITRVK